MIWKSAWEWVKGLYGINAVHRNSEAYWKLENSELGSRIRPDSLLMSRENCPLESTFLPPEDVISACEDISPF